MTSSVPLVPLSLGPSRMGLCQEIAPPCLSPAGPPSLVLHTATHSGLLLRHGFRGLPALWLPAPKSLGDWDGS